MLIPARFVVAAATLLALPINVSSRALPSEVLSGCNNAGCPTSSAGLSVRDKHVTDFEISNLPIEHSGFVVKSWQSSENGHSRRAKLPLSPSTPDSPSVSLPNSPTSPDPLPQSPGQPGSPLIFPDPSNPSSVAQPSNPGAPLIFPDPANPKPDAAPDSTPGAPLIFPTPSVSQKPDQSAPSASSPEQTAPAASNLNGNPKPVCRRSRQGLSTRATCDPENSGDLNTEQSGQRSDPEPEAQEGRVNPENWYEYIEPEPREHPARINFESRRAKNDDDKPFNPMGDRYQIEKFSFTSRLLEEGGESSSSKRGLKVIFDEIDPSVVNLQGGKARYLDSTIPAEPESGTMQVTTFSNDGQLIIADWSKAAFDGNPKGNRNKWNQLIFEQYQEIMKGDTSKLKYVGRSNMENKSTKRTLKTAIQRVFGEENTAQNESRTFTFRADQPSGSEEAKAFDALSWSDNVNGVWWMLEESYQALGRKRIIAVHARLDIDVESDETFGDLVLELGPA